MQTNLTELITEICVFYGVGWDEVRGSSRSQSLTIARCAIATELAATGEKKSRICATMNKTDATVTAYLEQYERRAAEYGLPLFVRNAPDDTPAADYLDHVQPDPDQHDDALEHKAQDDDDAWLVADDAFKYVVAQLSESDLFEYAGRRDYVARAPYADRLRIARAVLPGGISAVELADVLDLKLADILDHRTRMPEPELDPWFAGDAATRFIVSQIGESDRAGYSGLADYVTRAPHQDRMQIMRSAYETDAPVSAFDLRDALQLSVEDMLDAIPDVMNKVGNAQQNDAQQSQTTEADQTVPGVAREHHNEARELPELKNPAAWSRIFDHMTDRQRHLHENGLFDADHVYLHHRAALLHRIMTSDDDVSPDELATIAEILQVELPAASTPSTNPAPAQPVIDMAELVARHCRGTPATYIDRKHLRRAVNATIDHLSSLPYQVRDAWLELIKDTAGRMIDASFAAPERVEPKADPELPC